MITQIIALSKEKNFQTHLKKALLNNHKMDIYNQLKPQMGGFIDESSIGISILKSEVKKNDKLQFKCSIFYVERIGGCNCLDEPHAENGYCEMTFEWSSNGLTRLNNTLN